MPNLTLIKTHQSAPLIKQSRMRRDWMDETYNKHAYRCLPVSAANVNGWEIILQREVRVIWEGGNTVPRITNSDSDGVSIQHDNRVIADCNKIGMIDFRLAWAFQTDPGYETWLMGSPNYFIDGAAPLSAVIPSSWWPDETQFNWKITKVNEEVIFPEGTPIAFFFVYKNELEEITLSSKNLWEDQELFQSRKSYNEAKMCKHRDEPWVWMNGIRTGLNEKGERIGPRHDHHIILREPGE